MSKQKILIVRFSSIGDIVLTTPIVRCLKNPALPAGRQLNVELHFVCKEVFKETLINNPHIDKLHTFKNDISELFVELKAEKFDCVIDLHKNLRSLRLKQHLGVKSYSFDKINLRKFIAVNFKMLKSLPNKHIVDRYFETVEKLGVKSDGKGLDYFLAENEKAEIPNEKYTALVVGGSYFTKKIPVQKLEEICAQIQTPIVLLGGKDDKSTAQILENKFRHVINTCGKYSINQSAFIIKNAEQVITSDTGMMHIAAAFNKKIISVWGNTIPEFGMGPYMPNTENEILEVKKLECRPCSKLGFKKCPKGHFKCMMDISFENLG